VISRRRRLRTSASERLDGRHAGDDRRRRRPQRRSPEDPGQRLNTIRAAAGGVCPSPPASSSVSARTGATARRACSRSGRSTSDGHVQEVIVQNVVPNERSDFEKPDLATMRRVVAMARGPRSPEVSVQVPPNLSPAADLVDCGIDDLGGVSPSPTTTSTRTTRGPTSTASGRSPTRAGCRFASASPDLRPIPPRRAQALGHGACRASGRPRRVDPAGGPRPDARGRPARATAPWRRAWRRPARGPWGLSVREHG